MISKRFIYIRRAAALFFLSGHAFASSLNCSNADGTLAHERIQPDGGPQRGDDSRWYVGGEVLIEEDKLDPKAGSVFGTVDALTELNSFQSGDFLITIFTANAAVFSRATREVLAQDFVMCRSARYVGIPIP